MKKNTLRMFNSLVGESTSIDDDGAAKAVRLALKYIDFTKAEIIVETLQDDHQRHGDDLYIDKETRATVKFEGNSLVFEYYQHTSPYSADYGATFVSLNGRDVGIPIDESLYHDILRAKEEQVRSGIYAEPSYAVDTLLSIADRHPSEFAEETESKVEDDPELLINGKCLENLFTTPKRRKEEDLCSWRKHLKRLKWVMEDGADIVVASWNGPCPKGSLVLLFCRYCGDCDTIDEVDIRYYGEGVEIALNRSFEFCDGKLEKVTQYNGGYLKTSCTSIAKDFIEKAFANGVPFTLANHPLVNGMENLKEHAGRFGFAS